MMACLLCAAIPNNNHINNSRDVQSPGNIIESVSYIFVIFMHSF